MDNKGNINMPDLQKLNEAIIKNQKQAYSRLKNTSVSNSNWTFWGPKETAGVYNSGDPTAPPVLSPSQLNIYCIDVAPSDNNILYAGSETGYLSKSTDKGETWQLLGKEYSFGGAIEAVAINPINPDTVYVSAGNQIHFSTNGGSYWEPLLPAGNTFGSNHIAIDPENPSKIFATSSNGIYVSTDNGTNWTRKYSDKAWDVEFKPGNSDSIFVLCSNTSDTYDMVLSTDGGDTFARMPSFPDNIFEETGGLIAVTPANKNIIYVTTLAREGEDGVPYIYRGTFDGNDYTWTRMKKGVVGGGLFDFSNGQGYFDLVLEASPNDENVVFWGTCILWKSTNGGSYYTKIGGYGGDFNIHPDIQAMKMLPNGDTWVTTDGGVNLTTDDFSTQANHHVLNYGLIGSDMWGFDQGWNEDICVGGRYHNGNTAIADFYGDIALGMGGGESPTGWLLQGYSRHAAFSDLGNVILPKTNTGYYEGSFVFTKHPNMDWFGYQRSNLLHHPNYYDILYVGEGDGFWRSTDAGVSWDLLQDFNNRVRYMQISFSNPKVIYVDVVNKGLYRSSDGGLTWERKPKLTDGTYGNWNWNGNLFFAISPYDENVIYALRQGSNDKIYRSTNGGDSWTDWTGGLSGYTKCLVVQPTSDKVDLVYVFNSNLGGIPASVSFRRADQSSWGNFQNGFPASFGINIALPFYRDSKIRCAGNASVWESPMQETEFSPIINPWCQKKDFNCVLDTVYFDDHSMLNHEGVSWHWDFYPMPADMSNPDERKVAVVFGDTISYDVTLTVTKDGKDYSRTIEDMVSFSPCPTIEDCNNPAELPKDDWKVLYVDSEETPFGNYAENAIDNDKNTYWHTAWSNVNPAPSYPHQMRVDMADNYMVSKFIYLPRQDGSVNGMIKDYELYVTEDKENWGSPVLEGAFENTNGPKTVTIDPAVEGRYFKVVALSEMYDNPWASAAEFSFVGCYKPNTGIFNNKYSDEISAFPVPTNGKVNLSVLTENIGKDVKCSIYSTCGMMMETGILQGGMGNYSVNLADYAPGIYFIIIESKGGTKYRVKVAKK